jgi:hypothetical protein
MGEHVIESTSDALLDGEFPEALRGALGTLAGAEGMAPLQGMLKGMQLRRLPEAERWQKAQDELNLTGSQVEDLKAATQRLDDDMKSSMVEETRTTDSGATLTVRKTDAVKSVEARKRYQESVDAALDTEQRKKWKNDGFANAFGRSGGGGTAISVMSFDTLSNVGGTIEETIERDK